MSRHSAINRFGRSTNPAFSRGFDSTSYEASMGEKMTLDGAVNKTGILLALCFSGAVIGWNIPALIWPGAIVGFILAMVTIFRNPAKAGSTAVDPAFAGFLKIVTIAKIKPTIAPGQIKAGIFHPITAPEKHKARSIPVLLTAPSRVIFSPIDASYDVESKPLLNAGLVDLPNLFIAECLDIVFLLKFKDILNRYGR